MSERIYERTLDQIIKGLEIGKEACTTGDTIKSMEARIDFYKRLRDKYGGSYKFYDIPMEEIKKC